MATDGAEVAEGEEVSGEGGEIDDEEAEVGRFHYHHRRLEVPERDARVVVAAAGVGYRRVNRAAK